MPQRRRRETNKQRYSVDEMMEIARDTQSSKDGKSRRRRSSQPVEKRKSIATKLLIGGVAATVLIGGGLFILNKANALRYRNDNFKKDAQATLATLLGHEITLGEIEVNGQQLKMSDALIGGSDSSILDGARLQTIAGKLALSSLLGDTWKFETMDAYTIQAELSRPTAAAGASTSAPLEKKTGGFGLTSTPEDFIVRHARGRKVDLFFGGGDTGDRIMGTRFAVDMFGAQTDFSGSGGTLFWERMPDLSVDSFSGGIRDGVVKLQRARLSNGKDDEVLLDGEISLKPGGQSKINGVIEGMKLLQLLPPYWSERLQGSLSSNFTHTFEMKSGAEIPVVKAKVKIRDFSLQGVPVLDVLARYTAQPSFAYIQMPIIELDVEIRGREITIGNLEAQRPGLVRLAAEIKISEDDLLSGTIDLGVPSAQFDKIRGGRPSFFTISEDGYAWAKINITGSVAAPIDDLTEKLNTLVYQLAGAAAPQQQPGALPVAAPGVPRVSSPPSAPTSVPSESPVNEALEDAFDQLINLR